MRLFALALPAALLSLTACTGKEPKDTSNPPDLTGDDTGDCNAAAPVITGVTITNGGLIVFDNGEYPTVGIDMALSDDDGDLDYLVMYFWFDDVVDGVVDRSGTPMSKDWDNGATACMKYTADYTMLAEVSGGTFAYNTRYEFAVVGEDHHQVQSTPFITDGVTPQEDGSDGNAP